MDKLTEADTRAQLIDPKLRDAGWETEPYLVKREVVLARGRLRISGGREPGKRADYLLGLRAGLTVAVVEAKAEGASPSEGLAQALDYAAILGLRFAYSTNGHVIVERDLKTGVQREVSAFPPPQELWARMREEEGLSDDRAAPLLTPSYTLSGRPLRYYQERAVNAVLRAIVAGRPRVLLTMATGTGKTEVAFQICWRLWQSRWNPRRETRRTKILYLADRNILVDDPKDKTFSPFDKALCKIEGAKVVHGREMHFALYQTLVGDGGAPLYLKYPRDYFDLVIVDECHRGSASANTLWRSVLDYFHPAVQLGLTATPLHEDNDDNNRDSYAYFGAPVYTYSLKQGIDDGFLAPYRVERFVTNWDAVGWRPTQGELDRYRREIPDRVYSTADFERIVALKARTEILAKSLSHFLDGTDPMAKTIVFCVDQEHALELRDALARLNPDKLKKHPDWVCRVTSDEGDIGRGHLSHFQDSERESPVVLTTSQLLSTGVDAPNCRNVVLMRVITTMIEFKQIIGRGTRLCDEYNKRYFNILDYTNTATVMFADPDFDGDPVGVDIIPFDLQGMPETPDPYSAAMGVRRMVVRSPASPPGDASNDSATSAVSPDGGTSAGPPRKFYVDGGEGEIVQHDVYELTEDGSLTESVPLHVRAAQWVIGQHRDEAALRAAWSDPQRRETLLGTLKEQGFDLSAIVREVQLPAEVDPVDVLASLAFAAAPKTRAQRAERVRREATEFFDGFAPEPRQVLNTILDRYIVHGPAEFTLPAVLRVPPLSERRSVKEYVDLFGGTVALRTAVTELQRLVYEAPPRRDE